MLTNERMNNINLFLKMLGVFFSSGVYICMMFEWSLPGRVGELNLHTLSGGFDSVVSITINTVNKSSTF